MKRGLSGGLVNQVTNFLARRSKSLREKVKRINAPMIGVNLRLEFKKFLNCIKLSDVNHKIKLVELGGIEPPSVSTLQKVLHV